MNLVRYNHLESCLSSNLFEVVWQVPEILGERVQMHIWSYTSLHSLASAFYAVARGREASAHMLGACSLSILRDVSLSLIASGPEKGFSMFHFTDLCQEAIIFLCQVKTSEIV